MKNFIQKYKHAWVFLYGLIYLPWFFYLEKHVTTDFHVIHTAFDEKVPFLEIFIVPYGLWFLFMAVTVGYFFFADKTDFYKLCGFLCIGMTLFLIISTIYPNGQILRPETFERQNLFIDMVKKLYIADTPTNIFPSLHVYNTLASCIAVMHSERLKKYHAIRFGTLLLGTLIILSTMFLKQHSVIDVIGAFALAAVSYVLVYRPVLKKQTVAEKQLA